MTVRALSIVIERQKQAKVKTLVQQVDALKPRIRYAISCCHFKLAVITINESMQDNNDVDDDDDDDDDDDQ